MHLASETPPLFLNSPFQVITFPFSTVCLCSTASLSSFFLFCKTLSFFATVPGLTSFCCVSFSTSTMRVGSNVHFSGHLEMAFVLAVQFFPHLSDTLLFWGMNFFQQGLDFSPLNEFFIFLLFFLLKDSAEKWATFWLYKFALITKISYQINSVLTFSK